MHVLLAVLKVVLVFVCAVGSLATVAYLAKRRMGYWFWQDEPAATGPTRPPMPANGPPPATKL